MTETLKPCPFCGGKAKLWDLTQVPESWVECTECGARTRFFSNSEEVAVFLWSTRPIEEALRADNEIWREKSSKAIIEGIEKEGYHIGERNRLREENKRLREALEEIQDAITLLNTADVLEHISDKINQTLKGKEV